MVSSSNATSESRYVVEKPADKPAVNAETDLLVAATEAGKDKGP